MKLKISIIEKYKSLEMEKQLRIDFLLASIFFFISSVLYMIKINYMEQPYMLFVLLLGCSGGGFFIGRGLGKLSMIIKK